MWNGGKIVAFVGLLLACGGTPALSEPASPVAGAPFPTVTRLHIYLAAGDYRR